MIFIPSFILVYFQFFDNDQVALLLDSEMNAI